MEMTIQIPKAFSVRDDHEFLAFKHLMARLNPQLRVRQVDAGQDDVMVRHPDVQAFVRLARASAEANGYSPLVTTMRAGESIELLSPR